MRMLNLGIKRAFDILFSIIGLLLITVVPLIIVIPIVIRRTSEGPALFKQTRAGKDAKPFTMYKFRTMTTERYRENGEEIPSEDRITKVGAFLRKTSLDELPQLFNVLNGTMSLIGPRPMLPYQAEQCTMKEKKRFRMRPGISGLAQVKGRNNIPWSERITYDIEYVESFSVWQDIKIIVETIRIVLAKEGTNVHPEYRGSDKFSKHSQAPQDAKVTGTAPQGTTAPDATPQDITSSAATPQETVPQATTSQGPVDPARFRATSQGTTQQADGEGTSAGRGERPSGR